MVYAPTGPRLTRWVLFFPFAASLPLGCSPRKALPPPPELGVETVGCAAVHKARPDAAVTCELGEGRTVRVVLPPGTIDPHARTGDGGAVEAAITPRDEGAIVSFTVPAGAVQLVVEATLAGRLARSTIDFAASERVAWLDEARAAKSKGDVDRAGAIAAEHATASPAVERALAKGFLARIALARGRSDESFPLFREAIDLHRGAGRISDAADDSFALAFALHQRSHRYTEARAVLDAALGDIVAYPEGRAREPYYRGALAGETGDHRRALALLREAQRQARRLGMTRLERNARNALAVEMQETGRARASLPVLAALDADLDEAARSGKAEAPGPCERIEVANNRGWGALLVNEAAKAQGDAPTEDERTLLERALAIGGCQDLYVRGAALGNLARFALDQGDLKTAERRLAEAKTSVKEPRGTERLSWLELEARLHLAHGRAKEALRAADEGLALARAGLLRLQEWSLLVARAEVLEALGRTTDAIAALGAAEDVLDDATLLVPLGEGRGAFAGGRSRSARALVGLLVKADNVREAAAVGRRAQARVLASVERALRLESLAPAERAKWEESVRAFRAARSGIDADAASDWQLPADALARSVDARARRERELRSALEGAMAVLAGPKEREARQKTVAGVPAGSLEIDIHPDLDGFVALSIDGERAVARRVVNPRGADPAELGRALLDPVESAIARASVVRIRAYGAWRAVDIHALVTSSRSEPLVARVPVEYAMGLGASAPSMPIGGTSLVVGDPTSDLPNALREARDAARALMPSGPVRLLVRDEATSAAVADAMRGAARLHYAGHGVFAGEEGWESALPLAAGGRLTIGDVLSLTPAPRTVVLTGCDAAKSAGEAEGLGLAQAFIVAGSGEVLAPVRPVPDALTSRIATELYRSADAGAVETLATRARAAIVSLRAADPSSDWAAFRVLVP